MYAKDIQISCTEANEVNYVPCVVMYYKFNELNACVQYVARTYAFWLCFTTL